MDINGTEIVEKRNVLNEIRHNNMTLQELRFFSIYLSKINARNISTRKVKFKLEEFRKIMNIEKITIEHFKNVADSLLCKIVHVPNEDGSKGYTAFQLFKKCRVYEDKNDYNQWYVEIDAHDDALPLMFNFKKNYFKYELWNALRLKSRNQLHMYELLKQYESLGVREIDLARLKDWLGLSANEYLRWDSFKKYVLDACQVALKKYTDIKFEYKPVKTGRKVTGVKFIIHKNEDYQDKIKLSEFLHSMYVDDAQQHDQNIQNRQCMRLIEESFEENLDENFDENFDKTDNLGESFEERLSNKNLAQFYGTDNFDNSRQYIFADFDSLHAFLKDKEYYDGFINFLSGACNNEFSKNKMIVLKDLIMEAGYYKTPEPTEELRAYDYLLGKYHELNSKENIPKDDVERRFGLLKWLIKRDI